MPAETDTGSGHSVAAKSCELRFRLTLSYLCNQ